MESNTAPAVCVITTVHNPLNSRVFHKETRAAIDEGYDVSMIAHDPPEETDYNLRFYSLGQKKTRFQRWSHLPQAYELARDIDVDIYHFHDPELLPVGILLQQRTDASVIYDAHEDYGYNAIEFRDWIPYPVRPIVAKTFPTVQSVLANRLDAIITTSESIAEQFRDYGHNRVQVIHNYPRTEDIVIKEPPTNPTADITLAYVGSLDHMRGLLPMLKLMRELVNRNVDVELWLLGSFSNQENEYRAKNFLRENKIEDYVKLHGYTPYEDIFSYLHAADIGLCLVDEKRFEHAIPTKMFEYMYSEIPVLATDATGTSMFITEETGWLVEQSDVRKQADIVEEKASAKKQLKQMGKKAKEQVINKYSWEQEKRKLISFYDSLLQNA